MVCHKQRAFDCWRCEIYMMNDDFGGASILQVEFSLKEVTPREWI